LRFAHAIGEQDQPRTKLAQAGVDPWHLELAISSNDFPALRHRLTSGEPSRP
jgi:hypothetical protein